MSYDISFKVKAEGTNRWVVVGDCEANITWNVREIIEISTGLEWRNEENNGLCKDIIPCIEKALEGLCKHPHKYKKYEPENGWGDIESTIRFFRDILAAWKRLIADDEEIANVATFWIE